MNRLQDHDALLELILIIRVVWSESIPVKPRKAQSNCTGLRIRDGNEYPLFRLWLQMRFPNTASYHNPYPNSDVSLCHFSGFASVMFGE